MNYYIERFKRLGFKAHQGMRIYECFIKYFDLPHLNKFLTDLEREGFYVADV